MLVKYLALQVWRSAALCRVVLEGEQLFGAGADEVLVYVDCSEFELGGSVGIVAVAQSGVGHLGFVTVGFEDVVSHVEVSFVLYFDVC